MAATLTITIPDDVLERLRLRAEAEGKSPEVLAAEGVELTVRGNSPAPRANPASILAGIAQLPTTGGDPATGAQHDRILYGRSDVP